ncbi:energy transducer TonB [Sphingomonas endolithica]|uniref:energy transducer TonB n=1 Tax=Sphingomonas endolithica TaxID=2972485 RepID=UPI0021AF582A|nr:energy transducer TonB [Sphingomonas sp. ZFBP2030]
MRSIPKAAMSQRLLLTWRPQAQCDGVALEAAAFRQPSVGMIWGAMTSLKPVEYRFDIGGDGRTVGIRRDGGDYVPFTDDIGPALSASRFAAGAPRTGCTVRFVPQQAPLASAALDDLAAYSLAPTAGALPREAWDRIYAAGTCLRAPRARPLTQVYPDFDKIEGTPGARDWSMVGYDTDAAGRPTNVRIVYGTHDAALDAAAVKALRESRYSGGARAGCLYPYWHAPEKLVAPPIPDEAGFRSAQATCPEKRDWVTPPVLRFPEPYRRRSIEGWAVVAYDIAPWGEIGNVRVLAAEPSDDFGKQAIQVMRSAKVAPAGTGAVGCTDRVKFVMGPVGGMQSDEVEAPPRPF